MLLDVIKIFLYFGTLVLGLNGAGLLLNSAIFKRKNYIETNIICGLVFFSFLIGILLALNLFDIKIILLFIVIGLIFTILNKKKLYNFDNKNLIIIFLLAIVFLISIKNNFYSIDDLHGYFFSINNFIINNGLYETDLRHRDYFTFPFFSTINALFISTSDFYSAWFFDIFFGSLIILFTIKRNIKSKKIHFFALACFVIFFSFVTTQETNSAKIIITALTLANLFEIEKYHKKNGEVLYIFILSILLIILKFITFASFLNLFICFIFLNKIYKKRINLSNILFSTIFALIIILPWMIYNFQVFATPLGELMNSPYHYYDNDYFKDLNFKFVHQITFFKFLYTRQIIFILILFTLYFLLCKDDIYFKSALVISFVIFYIYLASIMYSDKSNFLRYANPFFAAITCYLFVKIFNQINLENLNLKVFFVGILLIFLCIRINQNITIFAHHALNNIKYIIKNDYDNYYKSAQKYFDIKEIYPKNYEIDLKNISDKIKNDNFILLISRPYLFDFKKHKKIDYIEFGYGYALTKDKYPLLKNKSMKKNFIKRRNLKFLLVEKINEGSYSGFIDNHENSLIIKNLKKNKNNIHDIYGRSLRSYTDELLYDDFIEFLINNISEEAIYDNSYFSIYEIKY